MHRFTQLMRHFMQRMNAFSKKFENRRHVLALYFIFYNLRRVRNTLGVTPAMASVLVEIVTKMADVVGLINAEAAKIPTVRGPYRKMVDETSN